MRANSRSRRRPSRTYEDFIGDVAVSPDGRLIYAADLYHDSIVVINAQSGRVTEHYKTGRRPYRILFHPDGKSFFVSSWADGDGVSARRRERVREVRPHSPGSAHHRHGAERSQDPDGDEQTHWRYRLFVAAANTNSVFVVGVSDTNDMKLLETLNVALTARQPLGMTPSARGAEPGSDEAVRGVFGCERGGGGRYFRGAQPRGRIHSDGLVSDGGARAAGRARAGAERARRCRAIRIPTTRVREQAPNVHRAIRGANMSAYMQTGTMSVIDPLTDEALDEYTKTAHEPDALSRQQSGLQLICRTTA